MHGILSFSDDISTREAHRLIDEAIERHQAIILALKSQRNEFNAPISHLPPEILCKIFSIVEKNKRYEFRSDWKIPLTWVKLTHICRHWRNIGIDLLSLWTEPPLEDLPWVELMLRRSKSACLVLKSDNFISSHSILGLKLAFEHYQRVKEISLYVDIRHWEELQEVFPKSAPQLECLRLEDMERSQGPNLPIFGSKEVLGKTLMLRRLELTHFELNWDTHSHLLHALTHLRLHKVYPNSQLTWKRFADVMTGMPDLQVLHLYNAFPLDTNEQVSWTSIHLASLQTMLIHDHAKAVETFFSCITFPQTTKVSVECFVSSNPIMSVDFYGVLMQLGQPYSNSFNVYFQTLVLPCPRSWKLGLEFRLFEDSLGHQQMFSHRDISAHIECVFTWSSMPIRSQREIFTKCINAFFSCGLPLQHINCVYLAETTINSLEPDTLANTVGKLNEVRFFMAERSAARILVDALGLNLHVEGASVAELLCFPNLSSIHFRGSKFRAQRRDGDQNHTENDISHLPIDLLGNCLIQRSRLGAGLAKLTFRYCRKLFKGDIDLFRKIVDEVDWDEVEKPLDSEDEDAEFDAEHSEGEEEEEDESEQEQEDGGEQEQDDEDDDNEDP